MSATGAHNIIAQTQTSRRDGEPSPSAACLARARDRPRRTSSYFLVNSASGVDGAIPIHRAGIPQRGADRKERTGGLALSSKNPQGRTSLITALRATNVQTSVTCAPWRVRARCATLRRCNPDSVLRQVAGPIRALRRPKRHPANLDRAVERQPFSLPASHNTHSWRCMSTKTLSTYSGVAGLDTVASSPSIGASSPAIPR